MAQTMSSHCKIKLKNVEKTTRPYTYVLNQIPDYHTVEVINRFKRLDLTDRGPDELWMEVHNTAQDTVTETIPKKRKYNSTPISNKKLKKKKLQCNMKHVLITTSNYQENKIALT